MSNGNQTLAEHLLEAKKKFLKYRKGVRQRVKKLTTWPKPKPKAKPKTKPKTTKKGKK